MTVTTWKRERDVNRAYVLVFDGLRVCVCVCVYCECERGKRHCCVYILHVTIRDETSFYLKHENVWACQCLSVFLFVPFHYETWKSVGSDGGGSGSGNYIHVLVLLSQIIFRAKEYTPFYFVSPHRNNVKRNEHWRSGKQVKHTQSVHIYHIHVMKLMIQYFFSVFISCQK